MKLMIELDEATLKLPHMYFANVESYKGALILLINSIYPEVPGPTKLSKELESIKSDWPLNSFEERILAFSEAYTFYKRVIESKLRKEE